MIFAFMASSPIRVKPAKAMDPLLVLDILSNLQMICVHCIVEVLCTYHGKLPCKHIGLKNAKLLQLQEITLYLCHMRMPFARYR